MNKHLVATILVAACGGVSAAPSYLPFGPTLGYGDVSIPQSLLTLSQNPAAPSRAHGDNDFAMHSSIGLPSVGVAFEVGDIGSVNDELNALSSIDPNNIAPSQLSAVVDQINTALSDLSNQGYVKSGVSSGIPFLPLSFGSGETGIIYLSADASAQAKLRYLDSPVQITGPNSIAISGAVYNKAAYRSDLSIGYGNFLMDTDLGRIDVGAKINLYTVGTQKSVTGTSIDIQNPSSTSLNLDPSTFTYQSTAGYGLDLGVLLSSDQYQTGLTLANLGSPRFAYPAIGQDCATDPDPQSCYIAVAHSNEIALNEVHTIYPQLRAEAAMLGAQGHFIIGAAMDLNAVNDLVGDPVQWLTVSSAYAPTGWISVITPRLRLGLRRNLVGTQMNYVTFGTTLFRLLSIDFAQSLNKTVINDGGNTTTLSRSYILNIGFAFNL